MPFLCGIACVDTESSLRGAKGVVAWIVLCHSRESGNLVKPIKNLFF
ncbi:MAG TPA: hypothetical protein LFV92_02220 [Rickettsia endosymbiont of Ceroptres masudai]|nr:hypothetical protein [Rickettsia endosymbiont of Ceroptres masudai]